MKIQSILLADKLIPTEIQCGDMIVAACGRPPPDGRDGLADIILDIAGHEITLEKFSNTRVLSVNRRGIVRNVGAVLDYVSLRGSEAHVLLLGVRKVVALNPREPSAREILALYRNDADDPGFYNERVAPLEEDVLLIYEGGVARITDRAELLWHTPLTWNDVLLRVEPEAVWFWRELGDGSEIELWIDLRDGSEHHSAP